MTGVPTCARQRLSPTLYRPTCALRRGREVQVGDEYRGRHPLRHGAHVPRGPRPLHPRARRRPRHRASGARGSRAPGRAPALRSHPRPHQPRRAVLPHALEGAAARGTQVINNPFWWSADDKFIGNVIAEMAGVAVPKTVLLPHMSIRRTRRAESFTNLGFPARLGRRSSAPGLSHLHEARLRRRLEGRLQGDGPRGVLRRLRPHPHARHDGAGGDRVHASTTAATVLGRSAGADHALRPARRRTSTATCATRRRPTGARGAHRAGLPGAVPRRWATTSTRSSSRCATACRTRSTS